jgi:hypothetical protein
VRPFPEVVFAAGWTVESGITNLGAGPGIDWKNKIFRIPDTPEAPQMHRELLIQLRMGNKYDPQSLGKAIKQSPMSSAASAAYQLGITYQRVFHDALEKPLATIDLAQLLPMLTAENVPLKYRFAIAAMNRWAKELMRSGMGTSLATQDEAIKIFASLGIEPDLPQLMAGVEVLGELEAHTSALVYYYIPRGIGPTLKLNAGIKYVAKWLDTMLQQTGDASVRHIPEHEIAQVGWGKITWEDAPMYIPAKFRTMLDHRRKLDAGVVPKHIGRLLSDQRLFDVKRKRPGGTVLIDTSGSMGLSSDDIDKLVMAAPGCTVAVYGGCSGDDGRMRLLADKGKVAEREYRVRAGHGANLIDGPALMWLAKQNEPRFWVSDGCVTGTGESTNATLKAESIYICKRYHIKRVPHVQEALHEFKRTVMIQ